MTIKGIATHTFYTKVAFGYEVVNVVEEEFDMGEFDDLPQDDWRSETHQIEYSYAKLKRLGDETVARQNCAKEMSDAIDATVLNG